MKELIEGWINRANHCLPHAKAEFQEMGLRKSQLPNFLVSEGRYASLWQRRLSPDYLLHL